MEPPIDDRPAVEHSSPVNYQPMLPRVIEIIDVHKSLGGRQVLDGIHFEVHRGETLCIIGGSGQGKSVTLKHIVGLMKPDRGSVRVDGVDITRTNHGTLEQIRKKIGFLFQGAALLNSVSVHENVALPLREHERLSEFQIRDRVREVLALVDMERTEEKMPATLSGGMKKRVGLARAIVRNPEIILYDEPTAGLDPVIGSTINDLILSMQKKLRVTSILVTHDMSNAFHVSNRIAMLWRGKIVKIGSPAEFRNSEDPMIRQFVCGESKGPLTKDRDEL